ncbi:MAG: rRNA maturation RNase YbeY [Actinomycetota bacterium]
MTTDQQPAAAEAAPGHDSGAADLDGESDQPPAGGADGLFDREAVDGLHVVGLDESGFAGLDVDRWCGIAERALEGEGVAGGRLDLVFVDLDAMADLNTEHMGHEGPTDVLAFPLDGPAALDGSADDAPPLHLGDVIVCPQRAADQAPDHAGSLDAELTLLVVHGVLHVLGHDHAEPAERLAMQARERWHLARDGINHPVPVSG